MSSRLFQFMRDCGFFGAVCCQHGAGRNLLAGQAIVERLLLGAQQVGRLAPEWMPLEQAAVHLGCLSWELVERITDGRPTWIGRHLKRSGFASILVSISGLDGDEISAETFALSQGLTFSEILNFFRKGHSPAKIAKRETGRKDRIMLTPEQVMRILSAFDASFWHTDCPEVRLTSIWMSWASSQSKGACASIARAKPIRSCRVSLRQGYETLQIQQVTELSPARRRFFLTGLAHAIACFCALYSFFWLLLADVSRAWVFRRRKFARWRGRRRGSAG